MTMARRYKSPRVEIAVTQEVIDSAMERSSSHCMISEAVKRSVPDAKLVSTDLQTIRWSDPKTRRRYIYLTPRMAQMALLQFDQGIPTKPFSFRLSAGQSVPVHVNKNYEKASLRGEGSGAVPVKRGGRTPPLGPLGDSPRGGRRRSYGLRSMVL